MWDFTHGETLKSIHGLNFPPFPKDKGAQVCGSGVVQKRHLKIYLFLNTGVTAFLVTSAPHNLEASGAQPQNYFCCFIVTVILLQL